MLQNNLLRCYTKFYQYGCCNRCFTKYWFIITICKCRTYLDYMFLHEYWICSECWFTAKEILGGVKR